MTVLDLAKYISSDSLWNAQIIQIYLKDNKEIELVPRVGNHTILLGDKKLTIKRNSESSICFMRKGLIKLGGMIIKKLT